MSILEFLLAKKRNPDLVMESNGNIVTNDIIKERELKAKSFWEKVSDTEKILGRELTSKEVMSAMQRGMWPCTCCDSILRPKDNVSVYCPTCGLEFRLKNNKIQTKGNMSEEYS